MAHSPTTHAGPKDDWVRGEVRAVLRGEEVTGYPYQATDDLHDAIAVFEERQADYEASIASGVRRLESLGHPADHESTWMMSSAARVGKRIFDIVFASLALVFLAPLLALIAIAIRFDSRGPVLFRQRRVGRGGSSFTMVKFRTMVIDADAIGKQRLLSMMESPHAARGIFALSRDPRVTRIGRHLRRFGLDELPELVNVIRGEMSLVGPRPLIDAEADAIDDPERHPSFVLKPGMTGVSRVSREDVPLAVSIKLEDEYATHWSAFRDLGVLMRTLARLARPSH